MTDKNSGCPAPIAEAEQLRSEAMTLITRANKFTESGATDVSCTLLGAAAVLIDESGGEDACEQAFNLCCARGMVAEKNGEPARLLTISRRAHAVALKVYGLDHPVIGLALLNIGDALLQDGQPVEALAPLRQAVSALELSAPSGGYTREFMNGLIANARNLEAQALQKLPAAGLDTLSETSAQPAD